MFVALRGLSTYSIPKLRALILNFLLLPKLAHYPNSILYTYQLRKFDQIVISQILAEFFEPINKAVFSYIELGFY